MEEVSSYCLTEAGAGSDAASLKTILVELSKHKFAVGWENTITEVALDLAQSQTI